MINKTKTALNSSSIKPTSETLDKKSIATTHTNSVNNNTLQASTATIIFLSSLTGLILLVGLTVYFFIVFRRQKRISGKTHRRLDDSINSEKSEDNNNLI